MMLKVDNITKKYVQGRKEVSAVSNVRIDVGEGEKVYIYGPSGAGKSTLLHMMGGLSAPSSGKVIFRGKDIYRMGERERSKGRNRSFGFIFQFYHLLPELDLLENVMLPGLIKGGRRRRDVKERALRLLDMVELSGRIKHRPSELSGGEAQRAAISRALINSPDILFCDEPTGNLDSRMSGEIYSVLEYISATREMSMVIVSHQKVENIRFDNEYYMKDGMLWCRDQFGNSRIPELEGSGNA